MEPVIIDAGTLTFSEEDMTATGLLVPFGVKARSSLGEFTFAAGDIGLPEDLTGMSLNIEHRREDVVGAFSEIRQQPDGLVATFRFAQTTAGRMAFADAKSGKRKNLSAEVANVRIRAGKALPGAVLFAGALVEKPAFEGATLLAAEDTQPVDLETVLGPDEDGHLSIRSTTLPDDITVTADGETRTYTPEADPAEDNPEGGSTVTATAIEPGQKTPAVVPGTLLAGAPTGAAPEAGKPKDIDLGSIFAAMSTLKSGIGDTDAAETLLAALTDIKSTRRAGSPPQAPASSRRRGSGSCGRDAATSGSTSTCARTCSAASSSADARGTP